MAKQPHPFDDDWKPQRAATAPHPFDEDWTPTPQPVQPVEPIDLNNTGWQMDVPQPAGVDTRTQFAIGEGPVPQPPQPLNKPVAQPVAPYDYSTMPGGPGATAPTTTDLEEWAAREHNERGTDPNYNPDPPAITQEGAADDRRAAAVANLPLPMQQLLAESGQQPDNVGDLYSDSGAWRPAGGLASLLRLIPARGGVNNFARQVPLRFASSAVQPFADIASPVSKALGGPDLSAPPLADINQQTDPPQTPEESIGRTLGDWAELPIEMAAAGGLNPTGVLWKQAGRVLPSMPLVSQLGAMSALHAAGQSASHGGSPTNIATEAALAAPRMAMEAAGAIPETLKAASGPGTGMERLDRALQAATPAAILALFAGKDAAAKRIVPWLRGKANAANNNTDVRQQPVERPGDGEPLVGTGRGENPLPLNRDSGGSPVGGRDTGEVPPAFDPLIPANSGIQVAPDLGMMLESKPKGVPNDVSIENQSRADAIPATETETTVSPRTTESVPKGGFERAQFNQDRSSVPVQQENLGTQEVAPDLGGVLESKPTVEPKPAVLPPFFRRPLDAIPAQETRPPVPTPEAKPVAQEARSPVPVSVEDGGTGRVDRPKVGTSDTGTHGTLPGGSGVSGEQIQPWSVTRDNLANLLRVGNRAELARARPLLAEVFKEELKGWNRGNDPWNIWRSVSIGDEAARVPMVDFTRRHREIVKRAIAEGQTVPAEVLAEYPELSPRTDTPGPATSVAPADAATGPVVKPNPSSGQAAPPISPGESAPPAVLKPDVSTPNPERTVIQRGKEEEGQGRQGLLSPSEAQPPASGGESAPVASLSTTPPFPDVMPEPKAPPPKLYSGIPIEPVLDAAKNLPEVAANVIAEVKDSLRRKNTRSGMGMPDFLRRGIGSTASNIASTGKAGENFAYKAKFAEETGRIGGYKANVDIDRAFTKAGLGPILGRSEFLDIGKKIENGEKLTPKQKIIADEWVKQHTAALDAADAVGLKVFDPKLGEMRPVKRMGETFYPNMPKQGVIQEIMDSLQKGEIGDHPPGVLRKVLRSGNTLQEIVDYRIKKGFAKTPEEAIVQLKELYDPTNNGFFAGGEMARGELWPEKYREDNPAKAMKSYLSQMWKRIGEVAEFGQNEKALDAHLKAIKTESKTSKLGERNAREAKDFYRRIFGHDWVSPIARLEGNYTTLTKMALGFNAIKQLSTGGWTAAAFGPIKAVEGLARTLGDANGRQVVRESAAILEDYYKNFADTLNQGVSGAVTSAGLKVTGVPTADRFMRSWHAMSTLAWSKKAIQNLRDKPDGFWSKRDRRMFEDYLQVPKETVNQWVKDGSIPKDWMDRILVRSVRKFQFENDAFERTLWGHSAFGRMMTRLRSFSIQQARLWSDYVIPEAKQGNIWPIVSVVGASIGTGELYTAIRNKALGRKREDDEGFWGRLGNDVIAGGTFGLLTDVFRTGRSGEVAGIKDAMLPAAVGTLTNAASAANKALHDVPKADIHKTLFQRITRQLHELAKDEVTAYRNYDETKNAGKLKPLGIQPTDKPKKQQKDNPGFSRFKNVQEYLRGKPKNP